MSDRLPGRAKVVVVLHSDGYCEVFADGWTDATILTPQPWQSLDAVVPPHLERITMPQNMIANATPNFVTRPNPSRADAIIYAEGVIQKAYESAIAESIIRKTKARK